MPIYIPVNIKVRFGDEIFTLAVSTDKSISLKSGVEIWIKMRPGNDIQPMATIPDGTLDRYMHYKPKVISCDWMEV